MKTYSLLVCIPSRGFSVLSSEKNATFDKLKIFAQTCRATTFNCGSMPIWMSSSTHPFSA